MVKRLAVVLWFFLLLSNSLGYAQTDTDDFRRWLTDFRSEAVTAGLRQETVDLALRDVQFLPYVIEADRRQPEFKKSLQKYLTGALSAARVNQGRKMLREHAGLLTRISKTYQVQPRFLVALWGIESFYGRHTGKVPIVSALVTLAYDARRSDYFRGELLNALKILDRGSVPLKQFLGSWAGAMGQLQFMPSTFLNFAVDGNHDGKIDLWKTREDYLSSAANYLSRSGWQRKYIWGREVQLPEKFNQEKIGMAQQETLVQWQRLGVRRLDGSALPTTKLSASLVQPEGAGERAFLIYENYRTLLKWNRSHSFAIAVGLLADKLVAE